MSAYVTNNIKQRKYSLEVEFTFRASFYMFQVKYIRLGRKTSWKI